MSQIGLTEGVSKQQAVGLRAARVHCARHNPLDDRTTGNDYTTKNNQDQFARANKMVLYVTDRGTLVHPDGTESVTVGACRAYFRLTNFQGGDGTIAATILSNIDLPMSVDQTPFPSGEGRGEAYKIIRDGLLYIQRNGKTYTIRGVQAE